MKYLLHRFQDNYSIFHFQIHKNYNTFLPTVRRSYVVFIQFPNLRFTQCNESDINFICNKWMLELYVGICTLYNLYWRWIAGRIPRLPVLEDVLFSRQKVVYLAFGYFKDTPSGFNLNVLLLNLTY